MPNGAAPGERRGGRAKGTPNKATAARQDALSKALALAFARLGPDEIEKLSPAQLMRFAMHEAAKSGLGREAAAIAKDAAPYFDQKLASAEGGGGGKGDGQETVIIIKGGLPSKRLPATEVSSDPPTDPDPKIE